MITYRVADFLLVLVCCSVLFLAGCANFLKPEVGAIARQDARIDLVEGGVQDAVWDTKDLELTYSYSEVENTFSLFGGLVFDRSLTDSFNLKRFTLKINFLDGEGRVLETVDISPLIRSFYEISGEKFSIRKKLVRPVGASSIAFNYFGKFRGNDPDSRGDSWDIFYFPFD
ncbi:MAG: hypothetical protein GY799_34470 [Desulfobulbaceae bacterium]|nr:hypothetical protein [Desulfobulbaceae bacterium]